MSWSATGDASVIGGTTPGQGDLRVHLFFPVVSLPDFGKKESETAYEVAKKAAQEILESGAIGQGNFSVVLNGHANPGNAPADGWCNDEVAIVIRQK